MTDIIKGPDRQISAENAELIGAVVREMLTPILQSLGKMLENNTAAMDQIAQAQQIASDRLEALEKQVRLNTPVTGAQVKYLNEAIRQKARECLDRKGFADDRTAVNRLAAAIRKSVLARYGIGGLREIPRHEYPVAMSQIGMWADALTLRDVVKEARERVEAAQLAAGADGAPAAAGTAHQPGEPGLREEVGL